MSLLLFKSVDLEQEKMLNDIIVIILIAAEILVAAINIVVDLYAGVD